MGRRRQQRAMSDTQLGIVISRHDILIAPAMTRITPTSQGLELATPLCRMFQLSSIHQPQHDHHVQYIVSERSTGSLSAALHTSIKSTCRQAVVRLSSLYYHRTTWPYILDYILSVVSCLGQRVDFSSTRGVSPPNGYAIRRIEQSPFELVARPTGRPSMSFCSPDSSRSCSLCPSVRALVPHSPISFINIRRCGT
jgi:hypothetical protein